MSEAGEGTTVCNYRASVLSFVRGVVSQCHGLPGDGHVMNMVHAGEMRCALGKKCQYRPFPGGPE
eukprot:4945724-Pyramimonas_sp.AAC.1